jgi:spermidine synthase
VSAGTRPSMEALAQEPKSKPETEAGPSAGLGWYFGFFLLSGFCSILYELIWLRLAMAQFGVTTAMVSIVLSTFMAGLGAGSWAAGYLVRKLERRISVPPLQVYAAAEILIGCSAVLVPLELQAGRVVLEHLGSSMALSSAGYYVAAGLWLAFTLVPWCACMGATIPLGMFAIRRQDRLASRSSFSFLYVANVLGAVAGSLLPLLLIEIWGFNRTLQFGMVFNIAICIAAMAISRRQGQTAPAADEDGTGEANAVDAPSATLGQMVGNPVLWLLFATGLTSMGMEVVWTRQYTVYVGTLVYSFAMILGTYLVATFLGSKLYRWWNRKNTSLGPLVWIFVWFAALIPLLATDPRIKMTQFLRVPFGIALFSGLLGFLTPSLVDRYSEGDPNRAGVGYAVNVLGCILGPLFAGFLLLPYLDENYALAILAVPWLLVGLAFLFLAPQGLAKRFKLGVATVAVVILAGSFALIFRTRNYVQMIPNAVVRRDSTATVIAGGQGMNKELIVNGVGMTYLTPITKMMSAMSLTFLNHPPQNALVICFGMGTTHRSMLSWGIDSTVVDLVPSVPALFWYYHADAAQLLKSPHSHVVVDDGRRFLERSTGQYDVIVIDPPPPIGAAGSSLLYSREFYSAAKKRLRPDGILQQWYPGGDQATTSAITRALQESFPYVRAFRSFEGWGAHYVASRQPIPNLTPADLAKRMPPAAARDLVEWGPFPTPEQQFTAVLKNEMPIDMLINFGPSAPTMQDDRPVNEYGLLRHMHFSLE